MPEFLLSIIRFIRLLLSGHQAIAIENAALRLQLVAFQRKRKRPVLTTFDRVSGKALARTGLVGIELRRACCRWRVTSLALSIARWNLISTMATFPEAPYNAGRPNFSGPV